MECPKGKEIQPASQQASPSASQPVSQPVKEIGRQTGINEVAETDRLTDEHFQT